MNFPTLLKHPVVNSVLAAAVIGAAGLLWSTGGFVTQQAYAEDQSKLDQIVGLIKLSDYDRQYDNLDEKITDLEQRIEELQLYLDADPNSPLSDARKANIRRLTNLKLEAMRKKDALVRRKPK